MENCGSYMLHDNPQCMVIEDVGIVWCRAIVIMFTDTFFFFLMASPYIQTFTDYISSWKFENFGFYILLEYSSVYKYKYN